MNICDEVKLALDNAFMCSDKGNSAIVLTHCLYPSFTPVSVTVTKLRGGFLISDNGGAYASAWDHGRNKFLIIREIDKQASRYHLKVRGVEMYLEIPDSQWLFSGIIAVANGSAIAATNVVNRAILAAEIALKDKIGGILKRKQFSLFEVASEVEIKGASGRPYNFDFSIVKPHGDGTILVDAISDHHSSISHKYTAFSDILNGGYERSNNMAVYENGLSHDDSKLMQQVADLVPFASFKLGTLKALAE